jgi:uncharacterized membrane protein/protein-disulfide isomerase
MKPREILLRVAALVGLAASSVLLFDYLQPVAGFCGAGGGCDAARQSAWSHVGPIPLPAFGVSFFAVVTMLLVIPEPRARRLLLLVSAPGAAAGALFLGVQAVSLGAFCKFCVAADGSALIVFALALWGRREEPAGATGRLVAGLGGMVAVLLPIIIGMARLPPAGAAEAKQVAELPKPIADEQRPGVVTIYEYLDFECPFCRKQHAALERILPAYGDKVRVVRRNVPLGGHKNALHAARAYCCAEEQGAGEPMAQALMQVEDLSPAGCEKLATELGLDVARYRECLVSETTKARIKREGEEFTAQLQPGEGLPTFYIGREKWVGLVDDAAVKASIERALATAER